ncbi:hypothetical protein [Antrihabitans cavernicola]|uniref:hypothetical protein n=1 Tax=Antrihabitans cavernicola TaxID=2495913 RepID=UPI001658E266|nr:hypothetical protein [Spelaeibacter cavernicola]
MAIAFDIDADLRPFIEDIENAKALLMIEDALATASVAAPCILEDGFKYPAAAKAIIRGAILRWAESGTGAKSQVSDTAGQFGHTETLDTRQVRRAMFYPTEITDLQKLCKSSRGKAFTIDTMPPEPGIAPTLAGAWVNGPCGTEPGL